MATVHPSRLGLVPQDSSHRDNQARRGRSQSPRDRYYSSRDRSRSRDREGRNERRDRDRREGDRGYERRASPKYEDYRQPPPHLDQPRPSMYPNRGGGGGGGGRPYGGMSNADWFESRRAEREARTVDVWPPSPKGPERTLSPRRKKSKKSKRARSYSSDTDSSEEERRRRKEKKRSRKHKNEEKKSRNRSRSRSPSRERHRSSRRDDSEIEDERRHRGKDRSRSRSTRVKSVTRSPSHQPPRSPSPASERHLPASGTLSSTSTAKGKGRDQASDSDEEVGPLPAMQANTVKRLNERDYGGALLRGEGSAMAAFLQDDPDVRIPRRGEIGLTSDQIAKYEDSGYVMSGSRHKRMNAVRMRKENQVISAEEKRGILKLQKEERERREAILREEFNEIVNEKLKAANVNPDAVSSAPPPSP